jgi:hypothetical protein
MLQIISANDLSDGMVVYFVVPGTWTRDIAQAKTFASESDVEAGLALAKGDVKNDLIVDPFAVDVTATASDGLEAVSLRNAIRAKGPTVSFLPKSAS